MKNNDLLKKLENVEKLIDKENYDAAKQQIQKVMKSIPKDKDPASEYVDDLVQKMK